MATAGLVWSLHGFAEDQEALDLYGLDVVAELANNFSKPIAKKKPTFFFNSFHWSTGGGKAVIQFHCLNADIFHANANRVAGAKKRGFISFENRMVRILDYHFIVMFIKLTSYDIF